MNGFVYFIETHDGKFVKIGFSTRVFSRFSELGTLRPSDYALRLIGCFPASQSTEKWLHQKFAEFRDNGEWFRSSEELRTFIATIGVVKPVYMAKTLDQDGDNCLVVHELIREVFAAHAAEMGRKGGTNRNLRLSPERRKEIAIQARRARTDKLRRRNGFSSITEAA